MVDGGFLFLYLGLWSFVDIGIAGLGKVGFLCGLWSVVCN